MINTGIFSAFLDRVSIAQCLGIEQSVVNILFVKFLNHQTNKINLSLIWNWKNYNQFSVSRKSVIIVIYRYIISAKTIVNTVDYAYNELFWDREQVRFNQFHMSMHS